MSEGHYQADERQRVLGRLGAEGTLVCVGESVNVGSHYVIQYGGSSKIKNRTSA